MILAKRVGVLYDRCSSIEIKDFSQNIIKVKSIDGFTMSEVRFDSKEELNFFDTKKAILLEIEKRIAADPNNKKLIENRKCIELAMDHADLKNCKEKLYR